jgi:TRAP-type C4-dicarboxylate transport system substrate-binding protein
MNKVVLSLVVLLLAGVPARGQEYPDISIRFGHTFPPTVSFSRIDQWFAEEMERRSGGRIKIKIFWSEALGKNTEMLDLIGAGAIEMGSIVPSFFPTRIPLAGITNALPLAFDSARQAQIIHNEMVQSIPEIQAEYRRNNVWPIFNHGITVFRILCTKPVATIEDFKNLRVRSYGEHVPRLWKALGAVGITTLPPEQYEGLQRGKLDCAYFPNDLHLQLKLHEVGKFWSSASFGALATQPTLINLALWEKLPPHVRKLFVDVGREAVLREHAIADQSDPDSLAEMQRLGNVKVVEFKDQAKLDAIGPSFFDQWIENMTSKGLGDPAKRMVDYWRKRRAELK